MNKWWKRIPGHLAQMDEDGRQEEGVGCKVLKLEAEVFQQQQQE